MPRNREEPMSKRTIISLMALFLADRGLGLALEHAADGVHDGERTGGLVRAVLDHPETRVLLLGSSRTRRHLDPRRFEAALGTTVRNGGCDGQGIAYARAVAALARARGSQVQLHVVDLNPFDLVDARESRVGVLAPYFGETPIVDDLLVARSPWAPIYLQSRTYRFNSTAIPLVFRAVRGRDVDDDRGFAPLADDAHPRPTAAPPAPGDSSDSSERSGIAHYRAFVREAHSAKAMVAFVIGPVRDGWSASDTHRIDVLVRVVRAEGATVVDLRDLTLDPDVWVDAIHLDAEGADELSRRAADALAESLARAASSSLADSPESTVAEMLTASLAGRMADALDHARDVTTTP
jgi:hypothetical protein